MDVFCVPSCGKFQRGGTRRYRTISHHSHVDECLFGDPEPKLLKQVKEKTHFEVTKRVPAYKQGLPVECLAREMLAYCLNGQGKRHKQHVPVVTKDLCRKLIVPSASSLSEALILPKNQFDRILQASCPVHRGMQHGSKETSEGKSICTVTEIT